MPSEVPILDARDMCIGPIVAGRCGCLVHWCQAVFGESSKYRIPDVSSALVGAHLQLKTGVVTNQARRFGAEPYATFIEHEGKVSRATAARVWNRAMASLGYIYDDDGKVINPECTRSGKLRPVK